jgi:WD40 repeat protein
MTDSDTQAKILDISEKIGQIKSVHFEPKYNEFFIISHFDTFALATTSGQMLASHNLPENSTVIGQQRTPAGWQFLCEKDSDLSNHSLTTDKISEVELKDPCKSPRTAAWSPCGQYVAVGSVGTTLSVWDTHTGKQLMQKAINWDTEEDRINPPTLSVTGWSDTGNEIICTAEEIISSNILVWDFKTNKLLTIIE